MKKCKICGIEKELDMFYTPKGRTSDTHCKKCRSEKNKNNNYYQKSKKSPLRSAFKDALIRFDGKVFNTNHLTETDIVFLKKEGYEFIFK